MRFNWSFFLLWCVSFVSYLRNLCLPQVYEDFLLYFLVLIVFFSFSFGLYSILGLYLHEVKVEIHFVSIWKFSCSSSICWKKTKTKTKKPYYFSTELLWHICYRSTGRLNKYLFCFIELCIYTIYIYYNFIVSLESR